uniref:Uncharacterized protein n=2 Tax=Tetraselmis sp. GSL018 TaxID=582737 RepID=A0A061QV83_9CHLO
MAPDNTLGSRLFHFLTSLRKANPTTGFCTAVFTDAVTLVPTQVLSRAQVIRFNVTGLEKGKREFFQRCGKLRFAQVYDIPSLLKYGFTLQYFTSLVGIAKT